MSMQYKVKEGDLQMVDAPNFDAPIPGMSLTTEVGNRPWQQPPRFVDTKDVADYYVEKLSGEDFTDKLVEVADTGIPLTTIANTIQMSGVMEGIHSVDSGILALPIIMEMLLITVEAAGVDYDSGLEKDTLKQPMEKYSMLNKMEQFKEEEPVEMSTEEPDIAMPDDMEPSGGLMSRRQ